MSTTRSKIVDKAALYIGSTEGSKTHRDIIDTYNTFSPLPRGYKVKYTDSWCAAFVSAMAILTNNTDVIPVECSCGLMLQGFKKLGEWVENDDYRPAPGDVIFYDWTDSGHGDNAGWPNHTGIVQSADKKTMKIIEGNYCNMVKVRTLYSGNRYIRGYGVPRYADDSSLDAVVNDVINGRYGNGAERKKRLAAAGYDYATVQAAVNKRLKG